MRARFCSALLLSVVIVMSNAVHAQSAKNAAPVTTPLLGGGYHVDLHAAAGPMGVWWWRGRLVPVAAEMEFKRSLTVGYSTLARAMWHPDHLLEVGALTGYQLLVTELYSLSDSSGTSQIHGRLTATPLMIDVAMTVDGLEFGLAIGGSVLSTTLDDKTRAEATRFELGSILHGQYQWRIANDLTLGAGLMLGYMGYRGLLLFAPQVEVTYALFRY